MSFRKITNALSIILEIIRLTLKYRTMRLLLVFIIGLLFEMYDAFKLKTSLKHNLITYITEFKVFFKEIFEEQAYHLSRIYIRGRKEGVILDCGAHIGLFTVWILKKISDTVKKRIKTIAIEPVYRNYRLLLFNIKIHNRCGVSKILVSKGWKASSSLLETHLAKSGDAIEHIEIVPTITLDKLIDFFVKDEILLIKMDIEGMEKDVLEHSQKVFNRTRTIVVEIHTTVNDPEHIIALLKTHGFIIDFITKSIGGILIFAHNSRI
jgi:FkbM family methyltransferase